MPRSALAAVTPASAGREFHMATRQLRLGAFMRPVSIHTGAWRYPGAYPDANFNFKHLTAFIQKLEAGRFDAFFMADHLAVLNMPMQALKRSATSTSFDPLTLLPALAVVTARRKPESRSRRKRRMSSSPRNPRSRAAEPSMRT